MRYIWDHWVSILNAKEKAEMDFDLFNGKVEYREGLVRFRRLNAFIFRDQIQWSQVNLDGIDWLIANSISGLSPTTCFTLVVTSLQPSIVSFHQELFSSFLIYSAIECFILSCHLHMFNQLVLYCHSAVCAWNILGMMVATKSNWLLPIIIAIILFFI